MKRITKILTVIIITALLFAALPAANAQVYRDTSTGAVISVPDNWSYTKLPVTDNYSVYDSNLRNIQKTMKAQHTQLGVTYDTEFSCQVLKKVRYGSAYKSVNNAREYVDKTLSDDVMIKGGIFGTPIISKISGKEYITLSNSLYQVFIHVENERVYQFEFEMFNENEKIIDAVLGAVKYPSKEQAASANDYEKTRPTKKSANTTSSSSKSGGSVTPIFVIIVVIVLIGCVYLNRICRTKSYQSKPSISQGFKKFNSDAVSKKPLPKEEKKPKPDPVEEARKKHEDELREFDENDGYLKLDGAGFNERPDRSGLAELALDTANGYPQLTWAYYERNAEHGNSIVLGSAPLPQEKINNITPRDVVQFISEQSKNLPPYVVIDYDKIKKNEYLELWCEIVKELRS